MKDDWVGCGIHRGIRLYHNKKTRTYRAENSDKEYETIRGLKLSISKRC